MEKMNISKINYEKSITIEKQGKRSDIEKYLKNGYFIKENRNGYWVLTKPAYVYVTINNGFNILTINMKDYICNYYGRERISEALVNKFKEDICSGAIAIYSNLQGNYIIQ